MKRAQLLSGAALCGAFATLGAQEPGVANFALVRGSDTVIAERATRTSGQLEGEFIDRARGGHLAYSARLTAGGLIATIETTSWIRGDTTKVRSKFTIAGDSVIVEGSNGRARLPGTEGALAYINPSPAFLEQILIRARRIGGATAEIPLFIIGAGQTVPARVTWMGSDSAMIAFAGVAMRVVVAPSGDLLSGDVPAQQLRIVRSAMDAPLTDVKPDYSAPAGAPYTAQDVVIRTPSGITLAGTLTLPANRPSGRVPAVVTITGSGQQDRDYNLAGITGYRMFRQIADTLGRRGIAVLRLDDRGIGGSDGNPAAATSADFADDIRAAVAYLRTRNEIDGSRIGLVGHSEGGMIAPMVAATDAKIHALVLMAGPSRTGRRVLEYQNMYVIDSVARVTGARRDSLVRMIPKALDSLSAANPWFHYFMQHDPLTTARQVRASVLIMQGERDTQVTPDQAGELADAFHSAGNRDVVVRMFPQTNHLFLADPHGDSRGYAALPSKVVSADVLGAIADWLTVRMK